MSVARPAEAPPAAPPPRSTTRWVHVSLALRAEHLDVLRRWAVEEDRPVELHLQRVLRLAAVRYAAQHPRNGDAHDELEAAEVAA